jgi:hypothetical protein
MDVQPSPSHPSLTATKAPEGRLERDAWFFGCLIFPLLQNTPPTALLCFETIYRCLYFLIENMFLEVNDYADHLLQQVGKKQQLLGFYKKYSINVSGLF